MNDSIDGGLGTDTILFTSQSFLMGQGNLNLTNSALSIDGIEQLSFDSGLTSSALFLDAAFLVGLGSSDVSQGAATVTIVGDSTNLVDLANDNSFRLSGTGAWALTTTQNASGYSIYTHTDVNNAVDVVAVIDTAHLAAG
ncbi:MAG: hypothetical protein EPN26_05190 [Rhodospirillales bacterium]|nr:MAG: hypothetical protein EPN26_05190 [Rhodospirillales bacterium]